MPWRAVVIDDHSLIREAMCERLARASGHPVRQAATYAAGEALLATCQAGTVAVIDWSLPGGIGLHLVPTAAARGIRALLYTGFITPSLVEQAMSAGARGIVSKNSPVPDVVDLAITLATVDGWRMDATSSQLLKAALPEPEATLLRGTAEGWTVAQLSRETGLSLATVKRRRARWLRGHPASAALLHARRLGVLDPAMAHGLTRPIE